MSPQRPGQGEPCPPSLREALRRDRDPVLHVACHHCGATPGKPCHRPSGQLLSKAHATRYEAADLPPVLPDTQRRRT